MTPVYPVQKYLLTIFFLCLALTTFWHCAEREKRNPLDPDNPEDKAPVNVWVVSYEDRIVVSWDSPRLQDIEGFALYRKVEPDTVFTQYAFPLLASRREFADYHIEYGKRHSYYVTIIGQQDIESKPSETVSTVPGPGFNWVVDRHGYQIMKFTYDAEHRIFRMDTPPVPEDIAIIKEKNIGMVIFSVSGLMESFNTVTGGWLEQFEEIRHPYRIVADNEFFWIMDSSGALYRMNPDDNDIRLIHTNLLQPTALAADTSNGIIYLTDSGLNRVFLFNRQGLLLRTIDSLGVQPLKAPESIAVNPVGRQLWIVENGKQKDYIYLGGLSGNQFALVDSLPNAGALSVNPLDGTLWVVSLEGLNSRLVQLSPAGTRQMELSGFYNPWAIRVNPYDGTLLVVDTGNYRLLHLNNQLDMIGKFTNFVLPTRIVIE